MPQIGINLSERFHKFQTYSKKILKIEPWLVLRCLKYRFFSGHPVYVLYILYMYILYMYIYILYMYMYILYMYIYILYMYNVYPEDCESIKQIVNTIN